MATTGMWPVRANLLALIKYTENPEKTAVDDALKNVIDYDMNSDKTEQRLYVTGINCLPATAYERMLTTKRQYGKTGGVLAYHAFQSFRTGEVTPLECHRIGVELARKLWGDRFEVTVSTHKNTDNLHNHFCINSVSFVDGKKFVNKQYEHIRLREESDKICEKNRLSVLYGASFFSGRSKRAYWKNKTASELEKEIIKRDFIEAASRSKSEYEFIKYLRSLGYYINRDFNYEHISVTPPGWNKSVRIDTIIPEYKTENLKYMLLKNRFQPDREIIYPTFDFNPLRKYEREILGYKSRQTSVEVFLKAMVGIIKIAMGLDDVRSEQVRPVTHYPMFRKEAAFVNEHQTVLRFISRYNIHTPSDIRNAVEQCEAKLADLTEERKLLYNRIRRPKATDIVEKLKAARDSLTADIRKAREELKTANKLGELLQRLEREVDEELALERGEKKREEPASADKISKYLNPIVVEPKPKPKKKDDRGER